MPCAVCKRPIRDDERFCVHCRETAAKGGLAAPLVLVVGLGLVSIKAIIDVFTSAAPPQAQVAPPQQVQVAAVPTQQTQAPEVEADTTDDDSAKPAAPPAPPEATADAPPSSIEEPTPTEPVPRDVATLRKQAVAKLESEAASPRDEEKTADEKWRQEQTLHSIEYYTSQINDEIKKDSGDENPVCWYYCQRGSYKAEMMDYKGAIADYSEVIRRHPRDDDVPQEKLIDAYVSRASAKLALNDVDGAIEDCSEAILISPENPWAYWYRGEAKCKKKDYRGAIEDCTHSLGSADYHKAIQPFAARADAYAALKKYSQAIADYEKALEHEVLRQHGYVWLNLGDARAAAREFNKARVAYKQAIYYGPGKKRFLGGRYR